MANIKKGNLNIDFTKIIADAFTEVMVPALDRMEDRLRADLATKEDIKDIKIQLNTIERKIGAQTEHLDRHDGDIETIKTSLALA